MAEQDELSPPDDGEDFGAFLGRRVRSYQTGVLGVGGLDLGTPPSADNGGIINRSADFSNSLQSLLSYRASTLVASAPGSAGEVSPATPTIISREADLDGETEPEPAAPLRFGTPEWVARMNENRKVVEEKESHQYSQNAPPMSAIESALGISGGASAEPVGSGPIRRRPAIREMSGTPAATANPTSTGPTAIPPIPASEQAFDETPEPPRATRKTGDDSPAPAPAETPRIAAPIVQRRPRRGGPAAVLPPPTSNLVQPTAPALPTSASDPGPAEPGESSATAPMIRRRVVPPPNANNNGPPEGRQGVRRVLPVPPQRPGGEPVLRTPSIDLAPSVPADGATAGSSLVIETLPKEGAPPAPSNVAQEADFFRSAEPDTTPSAPVRDVGSFPVPNQPVFRGAPQSVVSSLSPAVEPPGLGGVGAAQVTEIEPRLRRSVDVSPPLATTVELPPVRHELGSERTSTAQSADETATTSPVEQPLARAARESVQRQPADSPATPSFESPSNRVGLPTGEAAAPASGDPLGTLPRSIPAPRDAASPEPARGEASSEASLPIQRVVAAPESSSPSGAAAVQPATSTSKSGDRPEPGEMPAGEVQRQVVSAEPPVETIETGAGALPGSASIEGLLAGNDLETPTTVPQQRPVETALTGPSGQPAVASPPAPPASPAGAGAPRSPLPNNLPGTSAPDAGPPAVASRRVDVSPSPAIQQPSAMTAGSEPRESAPPAGVEVQPPFEIASSTETPHAGGPVAPVAPVAPGESLVQAVEAELRPAGLETGGRTQVDPIRRRVDAAATAPIVSDSELNAVPPIVEPPSERGLSVGTIPVAIPDIPVVGAAEQHIEHPATDSSVPALPMTGAPPAQGPSPVAPASAHIARMADPATPADATRITTSLQHPAAAVVSTPAAPETQLRPEAVQRLAVDPPAPTTSLTVAGDLARLAHPADQGSEVSSAATENDPKLQQRSLASAPVPASSTSSPSLEAASPDITASPPIEDDASVRRTATTTGRAEPTREARAAVEPFIDSPARAESSDSAGDVVSRSSATVSPGATAATPATGPATIEIALAGSPALLPPSSGATSSSALPLVPPAPQAAGMPRTISRLPEMESDAGGATTIESMPVAPVHLPGPASPDQQLPSSIQRVVDSTPTVSLDAPGPSRPNVVVQPAPPVDSSRLALTTSSVPVPIQTAADEHLSISPGPASSPSTPVTPPPTPAIAGPGIQRSNDSSEGATPVTRPPVRQRAITSDSGGAFERVSEGMVVAPHPVAGTAPARHAVQRSAAPATPASTVRPAASVPVRVSAASSALEPSPMPLPRAVQRTSEPVEMPLAPPVQREAASTSLSGPATGVIQRVESEDQALDGSGAAGPNYNQIAEAVWPHLKRKLRIERERERGLPS